MPHPHTRPSGVITSSHPQTVCHQPKSCEKYSIPEGVVREADRETAGRSRFFESKTLLAIQAKEAFAACPIPSLSTLPPLFPPLLLRCPCLFDTVSLGSTPQEAHLARAENRWIVWDPSTQEKDTIMTHFDLRDYQQLAVNLTLERLRTGAHRLYIMLPTGTGKSIILATLAAHAIETGRALVLVHLQDIALQLARTFHHIGIEVGLLMEEHRQIDQRIVIATPHSCVQALSDVITAHNIPLQMVFIDEAHHATAGSAYHNILTALETHYGNEQISTIGFTATPYRSDDKSMHVLLPIFSFARTIPEMIEQGWLAPLTWVPLALDLDLASVSITTQQGNADYANKELQRHLVHDALTTEIVQKAIPLIEQRATLLFALSVAHAQQFATQFARSGIAAEVVSGRTSQKERQRIYADWRAGRLQVVCNCTLLTEGFDFPEIAALIIARPTRSLPFYLQMLGRGTRTAPGKQDCLVIDLVGNQPEISQQILLPHIIDTHPTEATIAAATNPARPRHTATPSQALLKKLHEAEGQAGPSMLDPIAQSRYAWATIGQGYFCQLTIEATIIVERDPAGSGLYRSRLMTKEKGQKPTHHWIEQAYLPLQQQIACVHEATAASYKEGFAGKDAPWRKRPASTAQLAYLANSSFTLATQARNERWDRGQVSDALKRVKLTPTFLRPLPPS